jgi:hypothetical protein
VAASSVMAPRPPAARPPRPRRDELDQRSWDGDDVPTYRIGDDLAASGGDGDPFSPGAAVSHRAFGSGRIIEIRGGGLGRRIVVEFASVGEKTVDARWLEPG